MVKSLVIAGYGGRCKAVGIGLVSNLAMCCLSGGARASEVLYSVSMKSDCSKLPHSLKKVEKSQLMLLACWIYLSAAVNWHENTCLKREVTARYAMHLKWCVRTWRISLTCPCHLLWRYVRWNSGIC